ncbi:MAG: hypothetical protein ACI9E5_000074 [Candidatus Omnitrophota bacterium]
MNLKVLKKYILLRKCISLSIIFCFITSTIMVPVTSAQTTTFLNLPVAGTLVSLSPRFTPALIKGITIHPDNPLKFDFIVDRGDSNLQDQALVFEAEKMIKYFLASLTVPHDELWVNLSPYESDRIVPEGFGQTEMGRDLLVQDYILKQLTASLMYPEDELGKEFWERIKQKAFEKYGTTDVPMNTFNKVWIVPNNATVYEHDVSAFVVDSHLSVMLEQDYFAMEESKRVDTYIEKERTEESDIASEMVREIILPEIEYEVNHGKQFAQLRQIYNAMILAVWYKQSLAKSLLSQVYVDRNKTVGVDVEDKEVKFKIYDQYLEAFTKGVYNYIKEEYDPATQQLIPQKYFSGGALPPDNAVIITDRKKLDFAHLSALPTNTAVIVETNFAEVGDDASLTTVYKEITRASNLAAQLRRTKRVVDQTVALRMVEEIGLVNQQLSPSIGQYEVFGGPTNRGVEQEILNDLIGGGGVLAQLIPPEYAGGRKVYSLTEDNGTSLQVARAAYDETQTMLDKLSDKGHDQINVLVDASGNGIDTLAVINSVRQWNNSNTVNMRLNIILTDVSEDAMINAEFNLKLHGYESGQNNISIQTMVLSDDDTSFVSRDDDGKLLVDSIGVNTIDLSVGNYPDAVPRDEVSDRTATARMPIDTLRQKVTYIKKSLLTSDGVMLVRNRNGILNEDQNTKEAPVFNRNDFGNISYVADEEGVLTGSQDSRVYRLTDADDAALAAPFEVVGYVLDALENADQVSLLDGNKGIQVIKQGVRLAVEGLNSVTQNDSLKEPYERFRELGFTDEEIVSAVANNIWTVANAQRRTPKDIIDDDIFEAMESVVESRIEREVVYLITNRAPQVRFDIFTNVTNNAALIEEMKKPYARLRELGFNDEEILSSLIDSIVNLSIENEKPPNTLIDEDILEAMEDVVTSTIDTQAAYLIETRASQIRPGLFRNVTDRTDLIERMKAPYERLRELGFDNEEIVLTLAENIVNVANKEGRGFEDIIEADMLQAMDDIVVSKTYTQAEYIIETRASEMRDELLQNISTRTRLVERMQKPYSRLRELGFSDEEIVLKLISNIDTASEEQAKGPTDITEADVSKAIDALDSAAIVQSNLSDQGTLMREPKQSRTSRDIAGEDQDPNRVGGIDLNPELLDLQIKRDGAGVPLPVIDQNFEEMNIQGFLPIIINVTPVTNLPLLLGELDVETEKQLTAIDENRLADQLG